MSVLLDTNVLSELTRRSPEPRVRQWLNSLNEEETFISVISVAELQRGIALLPHGRRRDGFEKWLRFELLERYRERIIGVSVKVASAWGMLAAKASAGGRTMPIMDGFIAATAHVQSLTVATRNVRDFAGLGVKFLNPWEP